MVSAGLVDDAPAREPAELCARARRMAVVVTDCDGVLTDGGVYYGEGGDTLRRFNVRDGMGVERLREAGVATALLTRENSPAISRRASKLGFAQVYLGIRDKAALLPSLLADLAVGPGALAYIGDDVNDLGILERVGVAGLTAAPADAMPEVRRVVHYRCRVRGGEGAFRDFAEWILRLRRQEPF